MKCAKPGWYFTQLDGSKGVTVSLVHETGLIESLHGPLKFAENYDDFVAAGYILIGRFSEIEKKKIVFVEIKRGRNDKKMGGWEWNK